MARVREFDENTMLDAALAVFWQQGYAQTTMQALAAATGVQRGSLYNAYGDKDALFLRVFGLYRERYVGEMRRALDAPDLNRALKGFFDFAISSMTNGRPSRGCLSTKTVVGTEELDAPIHTAIRELVDDVEAALRERLSRPDAKDKLNLSAQEAARLLVTTTRGLVVIERVYQDNARMRSVANSLIGLLLKQ